MSPPLDTCGSKKENASALTSRLTFQHQALSGLAVSHTLPHASVPSVALANLLLQQPARSLGVSRSTAMQIARR